MIMTAIIDTTALLAKPSNRCCVSTNPCRGFVDVDDFEYKQVNGKKQYARNPGDVGAGSKPGDEPAKFNKNYSGNPFCAAQLSEFDFSKSGPEYSF
jgi:hypothetical protein